MLHPLSMKLNRVYSIRSLRCQPSEAVELEDLEEEAVAIGEAVVVEVLLRHPDILAQSIQTFLQVNGVGVGCISSSEKVHFSVLTHPVALGKTSTLPNQQNNEELTSLAKIISKLTLYTKCCMTKYLPRK